MKPETSLRLALDKQREITRHLREQLRAETMLSNALSDLRWHRHHQTPAQLQRIREALALRESLVAGGSASGSSFYPTGRKAA